MSGLRAAFVVSRRGGNGLRAHPILVGIFKILLQVIQAILKAAVEGFLAVVSIGAVWIVGVLVLVLLVIAGLSGFGGWRILNKRRNKNQP